MAKPLRRAERRAAAALAGVLFLAASALAHAGGKPGVFDYYVLTLSWSPTYCEGEGRGRKDPQCSGARPYAFVLHGLWPQYERGWPGHCDTGSKPWVPRKVIDSMLDIMPAPGLVIHEYREHGTCSGLSPEAYYALSRKLFGQVKIPARYLGPSDPLVVSPETIESDFLKTNPALSREMISISCAGSDRLREVRICFSRDAAPKACGENELQRKLCRLEKIVMPPVRRR